MRFDVHWKKTEDVFDGLLMDSRVNFNSTERKKHINWAVSQQQEKIDWGKTSNPVKK